MALLLVGKLIFTYFGEKLQALFVLNNYQFDRDSFPTMEIWFFILFVGKNI
jgi:hypothetical protein